MPLLYLTATELAAFREGRKTEHRVPVLAWNSTVNGHCVKAKNPKWQALDWAYAAPRAPGKGWCFPAPAESGHYFDAVRSRIEPGDVVNLPEAWCPESDDGFLMGDESGETYSVIHKADYRGHHFVAVDGDGFTKFRADGTEASPWISPVRMPAWAVRTRARILEVRAEWLHDIDEAGAIAEGCPEAPAHGEQCNPAKGRADHWQFRAGFQARWDARHGHKPGLSWESNPPVWRLNLEVVR